MEGATGLGFCALHNRAVAIRKRPPSTIPSSQAIGWSFPNRKRSRRSRRRRHREEEEDQPFSIHMDGKGETKRHRCAEHTSLAPVRKSKRKPLRVRDWVRPSISRTEPKPETLSAAVADPSVSCLKPFCYINLRC